MLAKKKNHYYPFASSHTQTSVATRLSWRKMCQATGRNHAKQLSMLVYPSLKRRESERAEVGVNKQASNLRCASLATLPRSPLSTSPSPPSFFFHTQSNKQSEEVVIMIVIVSRSTQPLLACVQLAKFSYLSLPFFYNIEVLLANLRVVKIQIFFVFFFYNVCVLAANWCFHLINGSLPCVPRRRRRRRRNLNERK